MAETPKFKLNAGGSIPAIGFGTWALAEGGEVKRAVGEALKVGYRLIDTAKIYGNEYGVGEAVRESGLPREEVLVTTKLWSRDQGYESALEAFEDSMHNLDLGYIDLYLIHWPGHDSRRRQESWQALGQIFTQGQAKAVGVSNYMVSHLEELLETSDLIPVVNQIEFHPFIYHKQAPILDFCKTHGIVVEAYSPLARGRQIDNPVLSSIAKKVGKTNAQVMVRWAIQHGTVPIPKSAHPERIRENFEVFDFELSREDMKSMNELGRGKSALPFWITLLK